MTQVQQYDEGGSPVLAPDSGDLGILWDSLAIIQENTADKIRDLNNESFSAAEFFKRLYMARAELDICSAALDLIDKPANQNIELKALNYQNIKNYPENGFAKANLAKRASIIEAAAKLRSKASELYNSTSAENEIVASTLFRLHSEYRWNILRITSHRQVTLYFDPSESTPIAAVNISPMLLFRTSSERYLSGEHLNSLNLGIFFRNKNDKLILKLQDVQNVFDKNLEISTESEKFVLECKVECFASDRIEDWNNILSKARFALLIRLIANAIEKEAASTALVIRESAGFRVIDKQMKFLWTDSDASSNQSQSVTIQSLFQLWYKYFLESSGESVNF
jgi:hypothetical protein